MRRLLDHSAIHAGQEPDPTTGAVIAPIHPSSTFAQDGVGGLRGGLRVLAQRQPHPHRAAGVPRRAGGRAARASRSAPGWAPPTSLLRVLLRPGDHVVIPHDAYGGTFRLVDKVLAPWGVELHARSTSPTSTRCGRRCARRPGSIWCETPTNPLLGIADIAAVADVAHERRRAARRRQHVRLAVPAAAARARRRRRRCTPPPSTSAATPTSSAARWSPPTTSSPSSCRSPRTRWARCPARSTRGSPCAA